MASVHEAWHDRLQFTTIYGLLVQHLWSVGDATGVRDWTTRGDDLLLGAQRTHEEFASVMTDRTSGDLVGALRADYPVYARHADRAYRRVGADNEYRLLHRVSALYRSCMQPADVVDAARDLTVVTAAAVPRRARPDHRLAVLTAALHRFGWGAASEGSGVGRTVRDYADEDDELWERMSRAAYDRCALLLANQGCPTLLYEGQLAHVDGLNRQAVAVANGPIRLVPASASPDGPEGEVDVVLRAFESEAVTFGSPTPWWPAPLDTGISDMVSGRGDDAHLFVCLRPVARVAAAHPGVIRDPVGKDMVLIRSVVQDAAGEATVVVLDVSEVGPDPLLGAGVPVVASVSMRSLADASLRRTWAPVLQRDASTVLVDLSLTRHVRAWLANEAARARYGLGRYAAWGREAVVLALQVASPSGSSRLHLAVVSPSFAAAFEVWLAETPGVSVRVERDDGLLDEHEPLVTITMGHLLAEEPSFDFRAGEAR